MKKLIKQFVFFSIIPSLLIIHNFLTDPFDYFDSGLRLPYNRMEKTRKFDIATWTLGEMKKIPAYYKKQTKILTIGDSRGQAILTNGYRGGWQKRMLNIDGVKSLDLCFGSAQIEESVSLLKQELAQCPATEKVYFFLSYDRLINGPDRSNRIEKSVIADSKEYPAISYLFDFENVLTFWKGYNDKTLLELNEFEVEQAKRQIIKDYTSKYNKASYAKFKMAWKHLLKQLKQIANSYHVTIVFVLPPYQPEFLNNDLNSHHELINTTLKKMVDSGYPVINLQNQTDAFEFIDAAHCNLKSGKHLEKILKINE